MSGPDTNKEPCPSPIDQQIENFQAGRRTWWRINASGWGILCLGALLQLLSEKNAASAILILAGTAVILAGVSYLIKHRLYRCPYCDGFLIRNKCLTCGKLWITRIHR